MTPVRSPKKRKVSASDAAPASREPGTWVYLTVIAGLSFLFFYPLYTGSAFLWEDFLYSSYPVRVFAATSMAMGEIPLWNPYTFGGMPFMADIINSVFYLPCMALVAFVRHGGLSFYPLQLMVLLHFPLAGISMFFLARSFNLRALPSFFSGVAYMLTGFMILHAIHQPVVTLAAWIPLILLSFRRALADRGWTWTFIGALVLGHSTLCGFPQLSLYIYLLLFAFWLFELFAMRNEGEKAAPRAIRLTLRAGVLVALSLGIALIQLLPTNELAGFSKRAQITYQFATEGSFAWTQLLTFLFPKLLGSSSVAAFRYFGEGGYWNYWETGMYLGVLPVFLALLALWRWREHRYVLFFAGFGLFALFFAMGNHFLLHRLFFEFIPGFSRFKTPARIGILVALCATLLAGIGMHYLLYESQHTRWRTLALRIVGAFGGASLIVFLLVRTGALDGVLPFLRNAEARTFVFHDLDTSFLVIAFSVGALVWMIRARSLLSGFALVAVLFVDLYLFGADQNNGKTDPTEYFAQTRQLVDFLKREGEHELFRVNTRNSQGMIMDRNQGMIDRIFMMEGYTPLALQRTIIPIAVNRFFDLENVKYETVTEGNRLALVPNPTYLPRVFMVYRVHTERSEDSLLAYMNSDAFDERTTAALEEAYPGTLPPDSVKASWSARVTAYHDNSITVAVQTDRNGLLIASETSFPGWRAFVDGKEEPIIRCDYKLRGIPVQGGAHIVTMTYAPLTYEAGVASTIGALLICGVGITLSAVRKSRRKST
jgi:hypothetical protein